MSDFRGLFAIRAYKESDKNFILSTFLKGLYYGDSWFSMIPKDIFMANYKKVAVAMVTSPNNLVAIACLPEDPDVILGYSILNLDGTRLSWVFVKSAWRQKGIAKALVPPTVTTVTHLSGLGKTLMSKLKQPTFNPFLGDI